MDCSKIVIISAIILLITAVGSASINFRDSDDINFFSDLDMNNHQIKNLENSLGSGQNWASYPAGENIKLNGNSLINRYGPTTDISEDTLLNVMEESDAREEGDNKNNDKLDSLQGTINLFGEIIRNSYDAKKGHDNLDEKGIDPIVEVFNICMTQCPIDLKNKDDIEFEYPVINASAGSITMRANQISSPPTKSLSINSERGVTLSGGLNLKKSSLNYRTIAREADCAGSADADFDSSSGQTYLKPSYYDGCGDGSVTRSDTVALFGEMIRDGDNDYIMEGGEGEVLTVNDVVTLFGTVIETGGTLDYAGEPPSYNVLSLGSGSTYNFASAKLGRIEASRFSLESNDQLADELKIDGSVNVTGDLDVKGSLTKESGSFVIDNPNPGSEHEKLKHSFVEAPTRGENIYRYTVNVEGEQETIQLPDYFNHLNEDVQEWVTADEHFGDAYAEVDLEDNEATVHAEKEGEYNLLIIGTRKDEAAKEHWDEKGGLYPN
jgi:hypothetical protein